MPSNKPWLDGPTAKDRAKDKMWQGGPAMAIGILCTAFTYFFLDMIWFGTVIIAVLGFFWFLTGAITYYTGIE